MKMILIRHAKVNCHMPKICDAAGFDAARAAYDEAPIYPVEHKLDPSRLPAEHYRFYVSTLQRTHDTLIGRIGDVPNMETGLLTEVPNRSVADLKIKLPYPCWQALGRLQWFLNAARQPEGRTATTNRAEELISMLEKRNEDCVLVSHEFYLYTVLRVLKRHGFKVKRKGRARIRNLEMICAVKPSP